MWVRGLKLGRAKLGNKPNYKSHPMWVRGLKQVDTQVNTNLAGVAPHVGAWIETMITEIYKGRSAGRTPCGCVD